MRPSLLLPLAALLVLITGAAPTAAQDWRPGPDDHSLAFALPDGGGSAFALWWYGERGGWGMELDAHINASLDTGGRSPDRFVARTTFSAGPAFKRYREAAGPVSPFLYSGFGVRGGYDRSDVDDPDVPTTTAWRVGLYGRLGLGVDWFPLERVSIGGYTGMEAFYHFAAHDSGPSLPYPGDGDRHSGGLDLFTSSLTLNVYF